MKKITEPFEHVRGIFKDEFKVDNNGAIDVSLTDLVTKIDSDLKEYDETVNLTSLDVSVTDNYNVSYKISIPATDIVNRTLIPDAFKIHVGLEEIHEKINNIIDYLDDNDKLPEGFNREMIKSLIPNIVDNIATHYHNVDFDQYVKNEIYALVGGK